MVLLSKTDKQFEDHDERILRLELMLGRSTAQRLVVKTVYVTDTSVVANLNADTVDGYHGHGPVTLGAGNDAGMATLSTQALTVVLKDHVHAGVTGDGGTLATLTGDTGETVIITGAAAVTGYGGAVTIDGGEGQDGGHVIIEGGGGFAGTGGNVEILGGAGTVAHGHVSFIDHVSHHGALLEIANLTTVDRTFSFPDASGTFALIGDAPTAHNQAETTITFTDLTTGDASTTAHGYALRAVAPAAALMNVMGIVNGETIWSNKALLDATAPATLTVSAAAAAGTATIAAHRDHVHPITSSSNPGAAASLLATDASGHTQLVRLGLGVAPGSPLDVLGASGITAFTGTTRLGAMVRGATVNTDYSGIDFNGFSTVSANPLGRIAVIATNTGSYLKLGTSNNYGLGITNAALSIDPSGHIGVGIETARSQFEVSSDCAAADFLGGYSQVIISGEVDTTKTMMLGFETETGYGFIQTIDRGVGWDVYGLALMPKGGNTGFGVAVPTARCQLAAGSATQYSAPLKFLTGTLLTTPEAGAVEFLTDDFFATITTGEARKGVVLTDGTNLTSGRVPFATTNGRLVDDADLTFATDTLSATKVSASGGVTTQAVDFVASTPDALAGDVNNWDLGNNTFIRATGGAADRIVTGIAARASGHLLIIQNIGTTNKLTFSNESASSSAANRLINGNAGSVEITPNHTIMYIYDATTARWREVTHLL
jgi:hypothetical protein